MLTLRERIESIKSYADQLLESQAERERFERFKTRAKQLHDTTEKLRGSAGTVEVLRAEGLTVSMPRISKELKGKPTAVLLAYKADPNSIANDSQFLATFKGPIDSFTEKLGVSLFSTWKAYVDDIVPPINESALRTLETAGLSTPVARLRSVVVEVTKAQRRLPSDRSEVAALAELKVQAQEAWAEIEQVPEAVHSFLRKASERKATLADLTDDVRAWLVSKELIGHLRISLA